MLGITCHEVCDLGAQCGGKFFAFLLAGGRVRGGFGARDGDEAGCQGEVGGRQCPVEGFAKDLYYGVEAGADECENAEVRDVVRGWCCGIWLWMGGLGGVLLRMEVCRDGAGGVYMLGGRFGQGEPAWNEPGHVRSQAMGESVGEAGGLAAQDFDLVGEAGAAAEDVVGQLGEDGGEAGGVGIELGEQVLGLRRELGERDGGALLERARGDGREGEGRQGRIEVVGGVELGLDEGRECGIRDVGGRGRGGALEDGHGGCVVQCEDAGWEAANLLGLVAPRRSGAPGQF